MTTEVTSEKTTVGFAEYYNHDRLIGWAVGADPATSVSLTLFVDGSPKASFAANDLRPDLRHLGNRSGKHGFDVALPRRTICQPFEVVAADGISLPVFPNAAGLDGWLDRLSSDGVFGWVWRVGDTEEKLTVEILLDNTVIGAVAADVFREDLLKDGIGSGAHSFYFPLSPSILGKAGFRPDRIGVKVAGTRFFLPSAAASEPVGAQVGARTEAKSLPAQKSAASAEPPSGMAQEPKSHLAEGAAETSAKAPPAQKLGRNLSRVPPPKSAAETSAKSPAKLKGNLEKPVNAMLKGWAANLDAPTTPLTLEVLCDGTVFSTAVCNLFRRDLSEKMIGTGRHGFELTAPANALDGRPHVFQIRDSLTKVEISTRELTLSRPSFYESFEAFLQHSTIDHLMQAPFDEKEKRCLAFMEFTKKWMLSIELTTSPLISIVMPAFNRQDVIGAAIDSVLAQTYTNWELLIVDDASSDETRSVIESYEDARIHNIFLAENGGCSRARNTGLDAARGEIIAYLDSDNEWDPDFLNVMVRAFQVDKTAESAYCAQYI